MIEEHARHQLAVRVRELLGEREGDTLMSMLPPVGWADVATKQDLAHTRKVLEHRIDALEHRMETALHREIGSLRTGLVGRMDRQARWFIVVTASAIISVSALPQVIGTALG